MIPRWALDILRVSPPQKFVGPLYDWFTALGCRVVVFRNVAYVDAFYSAFCCDHITLSGGPKL